MSGHHLETGEHQSALRRRAAEGAQGDAQAPVHPLLTLQSQIGNAQVARLLAQRDEDEPQAKHDLAQREGDEDKKDEQAQAKHDLAQRDDDEVEAKHEQVGIEGGALGPDTAQRIQSARGSGSSLDSGTRSTMESGFGTNFEDVRVHHDTESDVLTRRLTSHAFTTGSDIFLRADASPSDHRLLAHELTHVVQQRSMTGGGSMSVGAASDPHEAHADAMADSVLSGAAPAQSTTAAAAQRDDAPEEDDKQEAAAAKHDMALQRTEDDDTQAKHDTSVQREEDDDTQAKHDTSVQREEDEDTHAKHDVAQREEDEQAE